MKRGEELQLIQPQEHLTHFRDVFRLIGIQAVSVVLTSAYYKLIFGRLVTHLGKFSFSVLETLEARAWSQASSLLLSHIQEPPFFFNFLENSVLTSV